MKQQVRLWDQERAPCLDCRWTCAVQSASVISSITTCFVCSFSYMLPKSLRCVWENFSSSAAYFSSILVRMSIILIKFLTILSPLSTWLTQPLCPFTWNFQMRDEATGKNYCNECYWPKRQTELAASFLKHCMAWINLSQIEWNVSIA